MTVIPSVSIIIINYNGVQFLPACLDSLKLQTYPSDRFDVVVSDNGSTDGSLELLRKRYPWVKVLENKRNLGFAAGNNAALRSKQRDFFVLLNNDTAPHEDWLENLVSVAIENPDAGIVTSHLHLFYDYLKIRLISGTFSPLQDERKLGVQVHGIDSGVLKGVYQYLDGFYGWEIDSRGHKFRWTNGDGLIGLPIPLAWGDFTVKIQLAAPRPNMDEVLCKVYIEDIHLGEMELAGADLAEWSFTLPESLREKAVPVEQNTGSIVFRSGMSRDRGTYVKNNEAFFEEDCGQYAKVEEVFAGCGAGMLLRSKMLADVGLMDDGFFMYYEDTDLCWRARLRSWKVLYAPEAVVRHIHCGTTTEWSDSFVYLTERNRLAMVFKNGSARQILRVWSGFLRSLARLFKESLRSGLLLKPNWHHSFRRLWIYIQVLVILILWQPKLWWQRLHLQRNRLAAHEEIEIWFKE